MKTIVLGTFVCLCLALCLRDAQAVKISNCDTQPHRLAYKQNSEPKEVTLAPGENLALEGTAPTVGVDGEPVTRPLDTIYDYCIWHDGLAKQGRNAMKRGH